MIMITLCYFEMQNGFNTVQKNIVREETANIKFFTG